VANRCGVVSSISSDSYCESCKPEVSRIKLIFKDDKLKKKHDLKFTTLQVKRWVFKTPLLETFVCYLYTSTASVITRSHEPVIRGKYWVLFSSTGEKGNAKRSERVYRRRAWDWFWMA
jgi:hypothetical protein